MLAPKLLEFFQELERKEDFAHAREVSLKFFVTGADGLLGSHLVRILLSESAGVTALIEKGSRSPTLSGLDIQRIEGNILDPETFIPSLKGSDAVFHCAAVTNQWAPAERTWNVNFFGTKNILDAAIREGVSSFIHIGSAGSFGFGPLANPGDETRPFTQAYRGIAYHESKRAAMEHVLERGAKTGIRAVIVSPTFMIGSYDYRPSGGELIKQYLLRKPKLVPPGGRCIVNAKDAAKCALLAFKKARTCDVFIAGGHNITYFQFFTKVAEIAGIEPPKRVIPKSLVYLAGALGSISRLKKKSSGKAFDLKFARLSILDCYYSWQKASDELGYYPTPIENAIRESIEALEEFGHISNARAGLHSLSGPHR